MSAFFVLIGVSLLVAGSFLAAFLWSVRSGQYEDDYTPSVRMLFENNINKIPQTKKITKTTKRHAGRKVLL